MLAVETITDRPEEQEMIAFLDPFFAPLYEPLPGHNYIHVRDEVLREVLRLDDQDPVARLGVKRLELIPAALGHDAKTHVPFIHSRLAPLIFTKEERSGQLVMDLMRGPVREAGFRRFTDAGIANIGRIISYNSIGKPCLTAQDVKLGRADIANVGSSEIADFLAVTVKFFHEEVILSLLRDEPYLDWQSYLDRQHLLLSKLMNRGGKHGFAIGFELDLPGKGPFYEQGIENIAQLITPSVRDPELFVAKFGWQIKPRVADFDAVKPYITGQDAF